MRMLVSNWIAMGCLTVGVWAQPVNAGPLMDAWLNSQRPAYPVVAGYAPAVAPSNYIAPNYASVVANYGAYANQPPSASGLSAIPLGVPQTVPAYMPTAGYDTLWNQTPVTYYRPVTSFDPRTGTTVTSLQPCTSYQYQAQRVPLVSPRPLLGDYGMQANKWPSITGPGYYPTGLVNTANYPGYQQLPTAGYAIPPAAAAVGTSGTSMGMPASSLPMTTYYPPVATAPSGMVTPLGSSYVTSNYPTVPLANPVVSGAVVGGPYTTYSPGVVPAGSFAPVTSAPINTFSTPVSAYASPVNTINNSALSPAACLNGTCPSPTNSGAPQIPGAIVTPVGPPTYSTPINPGSSTINPAAPGYSSPVMPPAGGQVLPPGMGTPASDPESFRQPSLGTNASLQKATLDHLVGTAGDTYRSSKPSEPAPADTTKNLHAGLLPQAPAPAGGILNRSFQSPIPVPPTLPLPSTSNTPKNVNAPKTPSSAAPLEAPDGVDTKARWNPKLVDPNDPVALQKDAPKNSRLVTVEGPTAGSPIQFVSETRNTRSAGDEHGIYFRPRSNP